MKWGRTVLSLWLGAWSSPATLAATDWVEPMKEVHARFTGRRGTFAHFGDSITHSDAFWTPLCQERRNMDPALRQAFQRVDRYLRRACWSKWKGPEFGNDSLTTIRWADDNVEPWLARLNPEVVLLMFGTTDLEDLPLPEYALKYRSVVERCLRNGSVVIVSTIPPRSGRLDRCRQYNAIVHQVAHELKVPLVDYFAAVLERRPDDWDGSSAQFKEVPGDAYEVPTLICRDGVHPSNPSSYRHDYSAEALRTNGYALRTALTLIVYAEVVDKVLLASWSDWLGSGVWVVPALDGCVALIVGGAAVIYWRRRRRQQPPA